jgi:hypothetical protein
MTSLDDCFWVILIREQQHLLKVNAATGDVQEIKLDITPMFVRCVEDTLWAFSAGAINGCDIRQLDREGRVQKSLNIRHDAIDFIDFPGVKHIYG